MRKRLSTRLTFFWKYIFSTVWFFGFGTATLIELINGGELGIVFVLAFAFGSLLIYYIFVRAQKVEITNKYLYVSDFRKTVKIPLTNITYVADNVIFKPRPIFIKFKEDTEFGKQIMFIAYTQPFLFYSTHPAVNEIRSRVNLKKR